MLRIAFSILIILNAMPSEAGAAKFSGTYLLHICASNQDGQETVPGGHAACQSYIAGIIDYHNVLRSLGTAPSVDFCIPKDVDLSVLHHKVYRYLLRRKSQHAQFIASPAVSLALHNAYPCRKKK